MTDWGNYLNYDVLSPTFLTRKFDWLCGKKSNRYVREVAGSPVGCVTPTGYIKVQINGRQVFGHRVVWEMHNDEIPEGMYLDHLDGCRTNNELSNLRCVPREGNMRNACIKSTNKSGVTGVHLNSDGYWVANYMELSGEAVRKHFSVIKLGYSQAFEKACEFRSSAIVRLNEQGAGYTERHGL